jgi:hypothetical protein
MHIKQKQNNPEIGRPMGPGCKQMYYYVYLIYPLQEEINFYSYSHNCRLKSIW